MAVVFDMEKKYPGAIDGMSNPMVIGSAAAGDGEAASAGTPVGAGEAIGDGEGVASQAASASAPINVNARALRTLRLPTGPQARSVHHHGRSRNRPRDMPSSIRMCA
jgi:hypothetical protein